MPHAQLKAKLRFPWTLLICNQDGMYASYPSLSTVYRGVFRGGPRGPPPPPPQSPIPKKFLPCLSSLIQERIHQNCTAIAPKLRVDIG